MNLGSMFMSASASYEPQRSFNFLIHFTGIGGGVGKDLMFSAQSFPLPTESSSVITVNYGNTQVKFPGQTTWSSGSFVIRDFIDMDTEKSVVVWRQQVYNPRNDAVGRAVNYKKLGIISQVAPDGSYLRQWHILGSWPSDVDYGTLDYTADQQKLITMTIQFDKAYRTDSAPQQVSPTLSSQGTILSNNRAAENTY